MVATKRLNKQQGDTTRKTFLRVKYLKKRKERPNVAGVSVRSRTAAPLRKGCIVDGHISKASNK